MKYRFFLGLLLVLLISAAAKIDYPKSGSLKFKVLFIARINTIRAKGCKCGDVYMPPVKPVSWNNLLQSSALLHATDMSQNNYFDHTSLDGRTIRQRDAAFGYTIGNYQSFAIGENIAMGQESIDEVMNDWIKSPRHCENLMNAKFNEMGVAFVNGYWVQEFGGREPFK